MTWTQASARKITGFLAGWLAACATFGGSIVTTDGQRVEGTVSLEPGPAIVVKEKGGRPHTFPLDRVADADLTSRPAPSTQPAAWTASDLGNVGAAGATVHNAGRIELTDAGRGLREERGGDSLHFYHQRLPGDGQIVARLRTLDESRGARAGIMIRESLSPLSPFAAVVRQAYHEPTSLHVRKQQGEDSAIAGSGEQIIMGAAWLKLERKASVFSAFQSTDGKTWWPVGQAIVPMTPETPAYVGLFSAGSQGRLGQKTVFDNVEVSLAGGAPALQAAGVMMRSGSLLAGQVVRADDYSIILKRGAGETPLPASQAAWLILRPMPASVMAKMNQPKSGVLLRSEDFIEGRVRQLDARSVQLNSVLFGLKSFEIGREAIGVVLREAAPAGPLSVSLDDGSVLRAASMTVAKDHVMVGEVKVQPGQIIGIRRLAGPATRPGGG